MKNIKNISLVMISMMIILLANLVDKYSDYLYLLNILYITYIFIYHLIKKQNIMILDTIIVLLVIVSLMIVYIDISSSSIFYTIVLFIVSILNLVQYKIKSLLKNSIYKTKKFRSVKDDQIIYKDLKSLKKGDLVLYYKGEKVQISGVSNNNTYNIGDIADRDITIKSNISYTKLIEYISIENYTKLQSKEFKSVFTYVNMFLNLSILLITIIMFFILSNYISYQQSMYYAINMLLIFLPIIFIFSYRLPLLFHITYLFREGINIRSLKSFINLNKVNTLIIDKSIGLIDKNFNIVGIDNRSKLNLIQLIKTLEQNINDEIAQFFKQNEYPYLFEVKEHKIYDGGMKVISNSDTYYIGNARFFNKHKIEYEKSEFLGTNIYLSKNNKFLGSVTIRSNLKMDVVKFINYFKSLSKNIIVLSGDNEDYVRYIANNLGIDRYSYDVSKKEKLSVINMVQEDGTKIMMVGDLKYDKKLLDTAYISCALGNNYKDLEKVDLMISEYDINDLYLLFKARRSYSYTVILTMLLSISFIIFKIYFILEYNLSFEINLLLTLINILAIFMISLKKIGKNS